MDGVRTAEGGETGAMIRARIRVDGRLAGGLQALFGGTDGGLQLWRAGGIGHGKRRSRTGPGASLRGRWVGWRVSGGRAPLGVGRAPGRG